MEKRFNELSDGERAFYERVKKGAPHFYVHAMSIFGDMSDALIMEDEALAPFMSYCEGTEELLK